MAFKRFKKSQYPEIGGINEYLCSSIDDIAKLPRVNIAGTQEGTEFDNVPCGISSTAMVCDGSGTRVFILNPENNWVEM